MGKPRGESRGLAYLTKVRPAAMEHLLKFFGESGKSLEPKTRFLISIVTKVINFSPRGIEQYVKRALKEGASPAEVIDAVLCSYPCAGLTKLVDAIDVILDLGIPGFEDVDSGDGGSAQSPGAPGETMTSGGTVAPREPAAEARWVQVASSDEIPEGGALHVLASPFNLALFNVGGTIHAIDNTCPHKQGPLAAGTVTDNVVTCPLHGWKFHLGTGKSVNHPGARVDTYPVRMGEAGRIEILLPASGT